MANSMGRLFRVTTWGESHGGAVGAVVDGCPPRLPLQEDDIQPYLDRRRPGQSKLTSQRRESDVVQILSGLFEGRTIGTPILLSVKNEDAKSSDYEAIRHVYRPSHADYTYDAKYGIRNWQGGGRASARETVGRVAAGAIADKILRVGVGIEIVAWVSQIGEIATEVDIASVTRADVDASPTRCPVPETAALMSKRIEAVRRSGDSLGGIITLVARGVPPGLGEPVFDKLEADLARAMMSLPAVKGVEVGTGFEGARSTGSQQNDAFESRGGEIRTKTNRSGGIQGGISNGEPIHLRVAFKPTATISLQQETVDVDGRSAELKAKGRHDPCVVPRAVVIVEAMAALVLVDHWMRQLACSEAAARLERSEG